MKIRLAFALSILFFLNRESSAQGGWSAIASVKSVEANIYQPVNSSLYWFNFTTTTALPNGPHKCGTYSATEAYMVKVRSGFLEGAQAMNGALIEAMNGNYFIRILYDNDYCFANSILVCKTSANCTTLPN